MPAIKITAFVLLFVFLSGPGQVSPVLADSPSGLTQADKPQPAPAPVIKLTLARAKQIALENSPTPAAALERVVQAMETLVRARAEYLPTVSLDGSYDYAETTALSSSTQENQYTGRISVTQVLFQGFYRKYNELSARFNKEMNVSGVEDARRILAWSVAQGFLNAQLALEEIKIAESDMAFNRDQEKEALAKERLGTGSYSDVLNYKIKVNSARSAMISANQDYKEACYGLAALMGYEDSLLSPGVSVTPLGEMDITASPGVDINSVLDTRPDLRQDGLAVQEAGARVERAKSDFYPTISLTGAYGAIGTEAFDGLSQSDNYGAALGVEVRFDLFSGGTTRSAILSAAAEKREKEKDREEARITAVKEIRSAEAKVDAAREQLGLQGENTRLTQMTRDLVKKEYDAGQASLVRLNEAQNDLVAARGELADARAGLVLALEELDYYTGSNIR